MRKRRERGQERGERKERKGRERRERGVRAAGVALPVCSCQAADEAADPQDGSSSATLPHRKYQRDQSWIRRTRRSRS